VGFDVGNVSEPHDGPYDDYTLVSTPDGQSLVVAQVRATRRSSTWQAARSCGN